MFELHVSQISDYRTCPRLYYFKNVEKLAPKTESTKLVVGKAVHRGIAAYYSGEDALEVYENWVDENVVNADLELVKQIDLGRKLLEAYIDFAIQKDNFDPVAVEQQFAVPLWRPHYKGFRKVKGVAYVGRFDGIVRDYYGKLWLLEHKTCSSFPSDIELRLNEQAGYYLLAARQVFDEPVVGIIYNLIRKVDPDKAKSPVIERRRVTRTENELMSLVGRLYRAYRDIIRDKNFDPHPGMHCNWKCPYPQLCMGLEDNIDITPLKEELFEIREPYETYLKEAV